MLWAGVVWGCDEKVATAPDLDFLGVDPRTAEVLIPYEDFVDELQVFGGYGSPADFGVGVIASDFGGLNARALVPLEDFPTDAEVRGTDGVVRTDADLTFVGGRVLLVFDTVNGTRFW